MLFKYKNFSLGRAFTLVELMISISIVTLIVTVVLFSYSKFKDDLALSSASQEVAIAIRQAQIYGTSVKESSSGSGQFNYAYGIAFNLSTASYYYVFTDNDGDYVYDMSSGDTEVEKGIIRNKVIISKVCGEDVCPPMAGRTIMYVIFKRPSTDAKIYFSDSAGNNRVGPYISGKVVLKSPSQGKEMSVVIGKTGQVSIQ